MKRSWVFKSDEVGAIMARHVGIVDMGTSGKWSVSAQLAVKGSRGGAKYAELTGVTVTLEDEDV